MKRIILIPIFVLCILSASWRIALSQPYGWIDLSAGIPDSNVTMKDIHAVGQEVWIAHGNNPNSVVYYSSDGGLSFITQTVPDNSGMGMGVFMRSSLEGYIVSNTGRILRTLDGGNNWTTISGVGGSLYSISFPPLPEPTGYTCGSSGRIYSITDSIVTIDHGIQDHPEKERAILHQNQPNPFSEATVISWQIPVRGPRSAVGSHVTLKVFDFLGKEIRTIVNEGMAPGGHRETFDASGLPVGVYFYQLQADGIVETKKMIHLNK